MRKYIIQRFLQLIPILIGITFLSFAMMRVAGSDAVTEMYENRGTAVSQEIIDAKKAELGLDQPFLVQYVSWLNGFLHGDMGTSYVSGKKVFDEFVSKLPATLLLTVMSILATVVISIPLGVLAAVCQDKWVDLLLRFFSFIGNAMPNFFVDASDAAAVDQTESSAGHRKRCKYQKCTDADADAGNFHVCKVYAAGSCGRSGGAEQRLCSGSQGERYQGKRDLMEKRHKISHAYNHYIACIIHWKFAWRYSDH